MQSKLHTRFLSIFMSKFSNTLMTLGVSVSDRGSSLIPRDVIQVLIRQFPGLSAFVAPRWWIGFRAFSKVIQGVEPAQAMEKTQRTNPWKKTLKKQPKYEHISDLRNKSNGVEEYCLFSASQRPLEKDYPPRACCGALGECCLVLECDKILSGGYFGSEFGRVFIIAQRWWPRWCERTNSAGFVRWSIFFQMAESSQIYVPENAVYRQLVDSLHFTVRDVHWVPDKFADSQKASRIELSIQLRDFLLSIRNQGWGYGYILIIDE
jgi:hypothetical protein